MRNEFCAEVGRRIEKVREFRKMSRQELGEAIGLTGQSAVTGAYSLETSGRSLGIETIAKVAAALNVTPGFLLDGGEIRVEHVEKV